MLIDRRFRLIVGVLCSAVFLGGARPFSVDITFFCQLLKRTYTYGFCGEWLFVFPLCGFSLSLFCNYTYTYARRFRFSTVWLLPFTLL